MEKNQKFCGKAMKKENFTDFSYGDSFSAQGLYVGIWELNHQSILNHLF